MKSLSLTISGIILLMSGISFGNEQSTCKVYTAPVTDGAPLGFRRYTEHILKEKGYEVIQVGIGLLDDGFPETVIKEVQEGKALIGIYSGLLSYVSNVTCWHTPDVNVYCSYGFELAKDLRAGTKPILLIASIDEELSKRPTFFNSAKSIMSAYYDKLIKRLNNEIPRCH